MCSFRIGQRSAIPATAVLRQLAEGPARREHLPLSGVETVAKYLAGEGAMEVQGLLAQRRAARAGSCGEAWAGLAAMGPLGGPGVVVGQRGRVFLPGRRTGPFSPVPGSDPGGTGGLKSGHRTTAKLCILPASGPKGLRRLCQSHCDPCQGRRPGEMHVTGASAEHFGPL